MSRKFCILMSFAMLACAAERDELGTVAEGLRCATPCDCEGSPIIIDVQGNGFQLTDWQHGVMFDIENTGHPWPIAWTAQGSDDSFLFLDRNGNGQADGGWELFGDSAPQMRAVAPNGFLALAAFDENKDGKITSADTVWPLLKLWNDANHNARVDVGELHTMDEFGITSIGVVPSSSGAYDDAHFNSFAFKAAVTHNGKFNVGQWAWDVYFAHGIVPDPTPVATFCQNGDPGGGSGGGGGGQQAYFDFACGWRTDCFATAQQSYNVPYCSTGWPGAPLGIFQSPSGTYTFNRYGTSWDTCTHCTFAGADWAAYEARCITSVYYGSKGVCVNSQQAYNSDACYKSNWIAQSCGLYDSNCYNTAHREDSVGATAVEDVKDRLWDLNRNPIAWVYQ